MIYFQKCDIIINGQQIDAERRERMITKAQGKTLAGQIAVQKEPKLTGLEKAMLRWAVVDPDDRLLDADIGSGMMAEYLRRNMQCEVCGVSDNMNHVREARSRLQNCDIVYAAAGDIPWRDEAFDTVLMKMGQEDAEVMERMLSEAKRVLRPGGQLILGAVCYPAAVRMIASMVSDETAEERRFFQKTSVQNQLEKLSYEQITWQRTGFGTGVMIAWKPRQMNQSLDA